MNLSKVSFDVRLAPRLPTFPHGSVPVRMPRILRSTHFSHGSYFSHGQAEYASQRAFFAWQPAHCGLNRLTPVVPPAHWLHRFVARPLDFLLMATVQLVAEAKPSGSLPAGEQLHASAPCKLLHDLMEDWRLSAVDVFSIFIDWDGCRESRTHGAIRNLEFSTGRNEARLV
jgi:hypothetical protein